MIRLSRVLESVLVVAASVNAYSQVTRPALNSVTDVFEQSVSGPERATLRLANGMPEARYSFAPNNGEFKGVRTFSQLVKHVAVDNYMMGAALLGGKVPIDVGIHENGPDGVVSKAEIVEFLQNSFTYLHKAVATVNQRNLMDSVSYEGVLIPRLAVVNAAISHPWDIFGQMIEYLRMNGIDPQKLP
jgi:hypothetical protein